LVLLAVIVAILITPFNHVARLSVEILKLPAKVFHHIPFVRIVNVTVKVISAVIVAVKTGNRVVRKHKKL
jgi:hypothetical protein